MKPPGFDYMRVDSAEEALEMLAESGEDARVLAGGQSLMPILNMRLAQPRVVIDITRAADLIGDGVEDGVLVVRAATTQAAIERRPGLARDVPLLAQAFPYLGHFQTRNRGTVCGSIAHADPSAELPLCLALLEGEVVLRSRTRRRTLSAQEFFRGALTTARGPDELIESVRYPLARPGARYGFTEIAMRHGDFAIVALAAAVDAAEIHVAVGGVADRPLVRRWPQLDGVALDDALNHLAWDCEARDDVHASASYRRHLIRRLGKRLIELLAP